MQSSGEEIRRMIASATTTDGRPVQDDILEAAARCFMERGYSGTSIDDVAHSLGATKGRIYHHYRSKADLFFDVFRHGMQMNFDAVQPLYDAKLPPAEKLRRMARTHCRAMLRTQPFQRCVWEGVTLLLRGSTTPSQRETLVSLQAMRTQYSNLFRSVLEEARSDGDIDIDNTGIGVQLMFMSLNSSLFWYRPKENDTQEAVEKIVDQCTAFALRGLGMKEESTAHV